MNFCCRYLEALVENEQTPFEYDPKTREFSIVSVPKAFRKKDEVAVSYLIDYCPRCGTSFPGSLRDQWFELIEEEFGIEGIFDEKINQLPSEYTTDEWWKKRGL